MPRPTRRVPIQAIPSILTKRTKKSVKHFDNGNENIQLQHGLASNPMVQFSNGNGTEDLTVDEIDEETLHYWVKMSTAEPNPP
mmetsp:Transcript_16541/g.29928  ORF Transcript_16541/g.29928 Transcript_16541/m.29928 type:complete len:83 (-) Transcript_16541:281-529(-)